MAVTPRLDSERKPPPGRANYKHSHGPRSSADPEDIDANLDFLVDHPNQWAELSPEEGWSYGHSQSWTIRLRKRAAELGIKIDVQRWTLNDGVFRRDPMAVRARVITANAEPEPQGESETEADDREQ